MRRRRPAFIIASVLLLAPGGQTPLGRLEKGLDEARANGWTVVDMKNDWKVIYPFEHR